MSTLTVPSAPSSASRASALLAAVYGQFVPDLTVSKGDKLSLDLAGSTATAFEDVAVALIDAAGKKNDALGTSGGQQAEVRAWLARIGKGSFEGEQGAKHADQELTSKTFLVGEAVTAADLSLFASVHPYIAGCSHSALLSHPALTRHFDHVQNLPQLAPVLPTVFEPATVSIDVNNVPLVEIKPDQKVKKPKATDAAASTEASSSDGAGAKVKQAVDKAADAVKGATAAVVGGEAATAGDSKKAQKKDKKKDAAEGGEKKKKEKAPAAPAVVDDPAPWQIDLRVGRIVEVQRHPDADSLYVEKIDIGEAEPRTVVSGLVKYMTLEQMQGATLITVCNLKPANMRGIKSFAMVLCATSKDGKEGGGVEFVNPPAGSKPGDRVYFEGFADKQALETLPPKKKIFETVQPGFTTLESKEAAWIAPDGTVHKIITDKGVCAASNFVGASLS
ncbi:G4 quadruplex nucleic acid binding protein [Microbotryomycetes sp. JL201]|nr:G4 quadruplex nucleic acid binding protein [Microbotryomycetes sp. JL201]